MLRKTILLLAFLYFAALAVFIALLVQGRPTDTGVPEIGFGRWESPDSFVYISGRRLACEPLSGAPRFAMRCTVPIQGNLLTVRARPASVRPDRYDGPCEADYRGQIYPCRLGLHRGTLRAIALIDGTLGLSVPEREALRDRYWVENGRFPSPYLLALVSTLVALAAAVAWKPPAPGEGRRRITAYGVLAGLTFVFSCVLLFAVMRYLWD